MLRLPGEIKIKIWKRSVNRHFILIRSPDVPRRSNVATLPWLSIMRKYCYELKGLKILDHKVDPREVIDLALLRVCKQTNHESKALIFRRFVLGFSNARFLHTFLGPSPALRSTTTGDLAMFIRFLKLSDEPRNLKDIKSLANITSKIPEHFVNLNVIVIAVFFKGKEPEVNKCIPFKAPTDIEEGRTSSDRKRHPHDKLIEVAIKIMEMPGVRYAKFKFGLGGWSPDEKKIWKDFQEAKMKNESLTAIKESEWNEYVDCL